MPADRQQHIYQAKPDHRRRDRERLDDIRALERELRAKPRNSGLLAALEALHEEITEVLDG